MRCSSVAAPYAGVTSDRPDLLAMLVSLGGFSPFIGRVAPGSYSLKVVHAIRRLIPLVFALSVYEGAKASFR